jgi:electron transfer flavoprotein alpha subunit
MTVLVLAEHDNSTLKPATLNVIGAAASLPGPIHILVMGHNAGGAAQQATTLQGVASVLHADAAELAEGLAENLTPVALAVIKSGNYTHVLAPATTFGKNLLPRLAALMDMQQISDVIAIESADTFRRPFYAGNAIATVQSSDPLKFLTIRMTNFAAVSTGGTATITTIASNGDMELSKFVSRELSKSARPELTAARLIVSGGRALGSAENFKIIEDLADKLGAAVGASRAAVDAGYVPNDYQVGQTGKIVAPDLYIAIGISGAIQHLAGMKDSKVIVAINKDPDAPIFQVADYGLVADLFTAVPELTEKL